MKGSNIKRKMKNELVSQRFLIPKFVLYFHKVFIIFFCNFLNGFLEMI
jgi:hypothetical protein